jgi:hypothetical protein
MQATPEIVELRRLLAERFPRSHMRPPQEPETHVVTGVPAFDQLLRGGLPRGELTELVAAGNGSGSAQIIHALLHRLAADGQFLALVDGMDSFDVEAVEFAVLARLFWVRCTATEEALKAADILLRDRNFPFVVFDLKLNPLAQLRKISSSVWHRFRRLQEQNGTTLLVVTPTQLVGGAACRVRVESKLGLEALTRPPSEILTQLRFELMRVEVEPQESVQAGAG